MSITERQRDDLRKALDPSAITTRKNPGGDEGQKELSYLQGHYVIREMNRIFGNGGWSYRATVEKVHDGVNEKGNYVCTYLGRCVLTVADCVIEDVGAGQGNSKRPGDAIEKAAKEAATDALKRCCKTLGDPLGLALYDKEQRHVADDRPETGGIGAELVEHLEAIRAVKNADAWKAVKAKVDARWPHMTAAERQQVTEEFETLRKSAKKAA